MEENKITETTSEENSVVEEINAQNQTEETPKKEKNKRQKKIH